MATSKYERAQTERTGDGIAEGARVLDELGRVLCQSDNQYKRQCRSPTRELDRRRKRGRPVGLTFEAGKAPDNLVRLCVYARLAHSDFGAEHVRRCVLGVGIRGVSHLGVVEAVVAFGCEAEAGGIALSSGREWADRARVVIALTKQSIRCSTAPSLRACVGGRRRMMGRVMTIGRAGTSDSAGEE